MTFIDRSKASTLLLCNLVCLTLSACAHETSQDTQDGRLRIPAEPIAEKEDSAQAHAPILLSCSDPSEGWNPNGIHRQSGKPQFEGWYYRVTEVDRDESWVVIVAFWVDRGGENRAFIEVIQGSTGDTYKEVHEGVDIASLQQDEGVFDIVIGDVRFSADGVKGKLNDQSGIEVTLDLQIEACAYWGAPEHDRNRWTMGWVTELPGPPLKWHVHHLKGEASGVIVVKRGEDILSRVELDRQPLHQEKNWGNAFPQRWIWMQSNHFEGRPDVAFAAAGGPVFGFDFSPEGYMLGLRWRDQFFNWRTQDGHSFKDVRFELKPERSVAQWTLTAEGILYRVRVLAEAPISELIPIDIPAEGGLKLGAYEHLSADLTVELYGRKGLDWELIETLTSTRTALEAGGDFAVEISFPSDQ